MCRLICARTWYRVLKAPMCEHAPEAMANANLPTMATGGDDAVLERRARVGVPLDEEQQHLVHHDERHEGAQALITLNSADSSR